MLTAELRSPDKIHPYGPVAEPAFSRRGRETSKTPTLQRRHCSGDGCFHSERCLRVTVGSSNKREPRGDESSREGWRRPKEVSDWINRIVNPRLLHKRRNSCCFAVFKFSCSGRKKKKDFIDSAAAPEKDVSSYFFFFQLIVENNIFHPNVKWSSFTQ